MYNDIQDKQAQLINWNHKIKGELPMTNYKRKASAIAIAILIASSQTAATVYTGNSVDVSDNNQTSVSQQINNESTPDTDNTWIQLIRIPFLTDEYAELHDVKNHATYLSVLLCKLLYCVNKSLLLFFKL